jgi:antitoxin component of RelBE/YafQ-DinJ toxin-antitoxin module
MDSKITLKFDDEVIRKAKEYAASKNISLSRLVELLLHRTTTEQYGSLEDFPIADWVKQVSEGPIEYHTHKKSRKSRKDDFFSSRK